MDPVLVNGERTDKNRTEAEFRCARQKREADYIAREAVRLEQMQLNRLLGGLK
tara:strand:+ start:40887 stop:41045 length:159 start_codon:yes stop_codon:yes gene_type:complete